MLYTSRTYIEEALETQNALLRIYTQRLEALQTYKGYRLELCGTRDKAYYRSVHRETGRKEYLGDRSHPRVQAIMACRFCEEVIRRIRQNIEGLEALLGVYLDNRLEAVQEALPKAYRELQGNEWFDRELRIEKWFREGKALKDRVGSPHKKSFKVRAFDQTWMRSRLEALNYEAFHIYGIPCLYERPMAYHTENGVEYLFPGFTLLDPYTLEEILWECLGLWYHSSPSKRRLYRQDTQVRFDRYEELGFTHSHNLLTFAEGPGGFIDLERMHRQVRAFAQPPPSPEFLRKAHPSLF